VRVYEAEVLSFYKTFPKFRTLEKLNFGKTSNQLFYLSKNWISFQNQPKKKKLEIIKLSNL